MQTKKLNRPAAAINPTTAAGLEAAAEAAVAQAESEEFSLAISATTVESKQVTLKFNANLSLCINNL